jgi:hypothetical protein
VYPSQHFKKLDGPLVLKNETNKLHAAHGIFFLLILIGPLKLAGACDRKNCATDKLEHVSPIFNLKGQKSASSSRHSVENREEKIIQVIGTIVRAVNTWTGEKKPSTGPSRFVFSGEGKVQVSFFQSRSRKSGHSQSSSAPSSIKQRLFLSMLRNWESAIMSSYYVPPLVKQIHKILCTYF